jgi:hypothetical protein
MKKKWMVEHLYCSGWADAEWTEDDKPLTFTTKKEAEASIDSFIRDTEEAKMDYSRDEYRAVRVTS